MSTSTAPLSVTARGGGGAARILVAGALVGIFDILYAWLTWSVVLGRATAMQIPQSVAAGLLGRAAFRGGATTAALGLVLHFGIAYSWTGAYAVAVRRRAALRHAVRERRGAVAVGLLYGVIIWLVMTLIVMRVSRATPTPVLSWVYLISTVQHALLVGLPIVLIVRDGDRR